MKYMLLLLFLFSSSCYKERFNDIIFNSCVYGYQAAQRDLNKPVDGIKANGRCAELVLALNENK